MPYEAHYEGKGSMVVIIVVVVGVLPAMSLPVVPLHKSLEVWAIGWLVCVWVRVAIVEVVKDIGLIWSA